MASGSSEHRKDSRQQVGRKVVRNSIASTATFGPLIPAGSYMGIRWERGDRIPTGERDRKDTSFTYGARIASLRHRNFLIHELEEIAPGCRRLTRRFLFPRKFFLSHEGVETIANAFGRFRPSKRGSK